MRHRRPDLVAGGAPLLAAMLGVAGCAPMATSRSVRAPDGLTATSIECRQESRCIAEAQRLCPRGYLVVDARAREGSFVSRQGYLAPIYEAQMLIRCQ